jgi:Cys-tRNA(Pro)/Cys-tRNA(Cys) deacylase
MDLQEKLISENVWHRFIDKPETVHTADASRASGVELQRLTKNLVLSIGEGKYCLVIVPGNAKIDLKKVAKLLGVSNVSLVPFDQAENVSGYPPGGTPSVFHKSKLKVIIDTSLMNQETLFCGGGTRDKILELKVKDVIRLNNAIVAEVLKEGPGL